MAVLSTHAPASRCPQLAKPFEQTKHQPRIRQITCRCGIPWSAWQRPLLVPHRASPDVSISGEDKRSSHAEAERVPRIGSEERAAEESDARVCLKGGVRGLFFARLGPIKSRTIQDQGVSRCTPAGGARHRYTLCPGVA
ncbi:uncharacterized protein LOC143208195 isoform X2 [Lasioglossum baleicum]|uniref:uncharacterized protein LOC143208195 isoform X2 n=1 Tax=Lasioglossum baleicum TaxID=434251 RepID=UPI003FCD9BE2